MEDFKIFNSEFKPSKTYKSKIIDFLFTHLEEFGDPKADISKAIDYALKETQSFGGFVLCLEHNDTLVGAVVVNKTGMKDYIPENILVYIATHKEERGKGLGKKLLEEAISMSKGNVALHVEPNNRAKNLYEKVGFTNKYLEMRYIK
ncbi:MAG: GNAT family N-acetyltransferase [Marinifilaceae bacterium]|jgi:ribosomal protein S18 acetylase RimI-like enzyme|nr:GNAT family N-acetyltransferase [Marinifilaceae bacterium]